MLRTGFLRNLTHRAAPEWDVLRKKLTDPKTRAALDSLKNTYEAIQREGETFMKDAAPIDFNAYRGKIKTKGLVDEFEV